MNVGATTYQAYQLLHNGALALGRAERQGIRIDMDYCESKKTHLTRKIEHLTKKVEDSPLYSRWFKIYRNKTNIDSNHQLSRVLYKSMGIEPPKVTGSGEGSTDEDTLGKIDGVPELEWILEIRKLRKIRDTYLEAFIREQYDGYVHPFFNLHTVRTYRSSSDRPNFQNIPKRDAEAKRITRRALLPRPGHQLIEADYSGVEVAIGACYHKDPVMIKYIKDPSSDMHLDMARQIYLMPDLKKEGPGKLLRQSAKNGFVFPQFYGDYYANNAAGICGWTKLPNGRWKPGQGVPSPYGGTISDHLISKGITSYDQFVNHIQDIERDFWGRRFKVYSKWKDAWVGQYQKRGYFDMYTGFRCSGIMKKNEAVNYPIQGSAFHCLLWSFIRLDEIMRKEGWDTRLIGQIHDSIIMDVNPDELEYVKQVVTRVATQELPAAWKWINVPLEIEIDEYGVDQPWM
ncbi:MAG: DNA polymerase [Acholeplasmataceae bacterium]